MKKVDKEQAVCVLFAELSATVLAVVVTRPWSVSNPCTFFMVEIFINFRKIVSFKNIMQEIV